jgi:zinc D-Ala-D-Ala carboxypeptidase
VPTAFSTDGLDPVDPVQGESLGSYRGRRRKPATPSGADDVRAEPTVPVPVQSVALPAATILPGQPTDAPRFLTRAEAKAAARAAEERSAQQRRRTPQPIAPRPATTRTATARSGTPQLRTPLRQRTVVVDANSRRAPQRRDAPAPKRASRARRGLAAVAAVAAVGAAGAVATAAGALPSEASGQQTAASGPQAAAAVGVLDARGRRSTEQSSASIGGDLGDKAFRMVAVSRSQERGPIAGCSGQAPTEQYANGQLPDSILCSLPFAPGHKLRADAAVRLIRLNEVYKGRFGVDLCLTDSYRSIGSQYNLAARKPGLAARPGTSEHGWGLAVDVCGGPDQVGSARRTWFLANAPAFGWDNPAWARPGGSKPEPWHWEFVEAE